MAYGWGWAPNLKSKFNSNFSPTWLGRVPCVDPLPHLHKLFPLKQIKENQYSG